MYNIRIGGFLSQLWYNKHMRNKVFRSGFTMVELSLSIAFIAILSIAVVLMITNSISSYHRGLTLTQIETTGTDIVHDIRTAIQRAQARSITSSCTDYYVKKEIQDECKEDGALNFVSVTRYGGVQIKKGNGAANFVVGDNDVPVFGAFCTGSYSYIWNTGYFFNSDLYSVNGDGVSMATLKYKKSCDNNDGDSDDSCPTIETAENFRLLKVEDPSRSVCISSVRGSYVKSEEDEEKARYRITKYGAESINNNGGEFDITTYDVVNEEPVDLLAGEGIGLAVYDLTSTAPAEGSNTKNLFYAVSFILGSVQGGINIRATGDFCATPEGFNSEVANFDYCAINKFNFAAQAVGG